MRKILKVTTVTATITMISVASGFEFANFHLLSSTKRPVRGQLRRAWMAATKSTTIATTTINHVRQQQHHHQQQQQERQQRNRPYVEKYEEFIVREFWDQQSFQTSTNLVDSIINFHNQRDHERTRRRRLWIEKIHVPSHEEHEVKESGYEDLFENVYMHQRNIGGRGATNICRQRSDDSHNDDKKQLHLRLQIAYRGDEFCGYQIQSDYENRPSVQGTLEDCLTDILYGKPGGYGDEDGRPNKTPDTDINQREIAGLVDTSMNVQPQIRRDMPNKKQLILNRRMNRRASLRVAGRTDAGVHAIGQICRLRVHLHDMSLSVDENRNKDDDGKSTLLVDEIRTRIRRSLSSINLPVSVTDVTQVDRSFHPGFTSSCRGYVYLVDVAETQALWSSNDMDILTKRLDFLNKLFGQLEGKPLKYFGLSYGKLEMQDSTRTLFHARARLVQLVAEDGGEVESLEQCNEGSDDDRRCTPTSPKSTSVARTSEQHPKMAICIELVGNGFLRRMVRLLVQCAFQIVAREECNSWSKSLSHVHVFPNEVDDGMDGNDTDNDIDSEKRNQKTMALINHIEQQDRRLLSSSAPPPGLIFVGAR